MSKYSTLSLGMLRQNLFFLGLTLFLVCAMIPGSPVQAEEPRPAVRHRLDGEHGQVLRGRGKSRPEHRREGR